jgi:hypothetical protein
MIFEPGGIAPPATAEDSSEFSIMHVYPGIDRSMWSRW